MTPKPPALVTAAASSGPAATFMPARQINDGLANHQIKLTSQDDGMLDLEKLGDGGVDFRHGGGWRG